MRISQLPTLAACLSIGSLAAWAACGSMHDAAAAAVLAPAGAASQCQTVPVTSTGASPSSSSSASASGSPAAAASSPTPADLCVTVQAAQDRVQAGTAATWTVQVSAQNGPVTGVTVALTGTLSGQQPTFTAKCPAGNGAASCFVGDLATDVAASSYQMQAQIAIPSGTAANTSVTLTASANATPSLPAAAAAGAAVIVTAPPTPTSTPSPSSRPSASSTPSTSSTPAPSKNATPAPSTQPPTTPAMTRPATIPHIGGIPGPVTSVSPQTAVTTIADPGSIRGLLPTISPAADATAPTAGLVTSAAADNSASSGLTADQTGVNRSVFGLPTATAETLGVVILLIVVALAAKLRAPNKLFPRVQPGRASRGARGGPGPVRRLKPAAILHLRRQRGDCPKKTR